MPLLPCALPILCPFEQQLSPPVREAMDMVRGIQDAQRRRAKHHPAEPVADGNPPSGVYRSRLVYRTFVCVVGDLGAADAIARRSLKEFYVRQFALG